MYHFFVEKENITEDGVYITGSDFNHAVNVLRLRDGEKIVVSDPDGTDYYCSVSEIARDASGLNDADSSALEKVPYLKAVIDEVGSENHELPAEVVLFQCLPKSDKMELIIQKAVELGVSMVVPVESKNCIMKLDPKKADAKIKRWQAIAEAAAKQSKRSVVPVIHEPVNFKTALDLCENYEVKLIPYENERGIVSTCEAIVNFLPGRKIAVFIGPEGGFDRMEVSMAERHEVVPVSLGKRILRTETAAIAILSLIMIRLEIASGIDLSEE